MGNLFGKPKAKTRVTEQDRAVLQLKQQRDKLKQYQKKVELNLERQREVAKQLVAEGKKTKAIALLKKKRFQENLIERTLGQLDNIEKLIHDIEFAQIESQVVNGLKVGNECLKKMHEILTLDEVQNVLDEAKDSVEYQREIDQLVAGSSAELWTSEDEADIQRELEDIVGKEEIAELPAVPDEALPTKRPVPAAEKQRKTEALLA